MTTSEQQAVPVAQEEADAESIVEQHCEAWRWGPFDSFSGTAEWGLAVRAAAQGIATARQQFEQALTEEAKDWRHSAYSRATFAELAPTSLPCKSGEGAEPGREAIARAAFEADPNVGVTWDDWVAYALVHPDHQQTVDFVRRQADAILALRTDATQTREAEGAPYLVWSNEHRAWWGKDRCGYTKIIANAGRYNRAEALAIAGTRDGGWRLNKGNPDEIAIPEADAVDQYAEITAAQLNARGGA